MPLGLERHVIVLGHADFQANIASDTAVVHSALFGFAEHPYQRLRDGGLIWNGHPLPDHVFAGKIYKLCNRMKDITAFSRDAFANELCNRVALASVCLQFLNHACSLLQALLLIKARSFKTPLQDAVCLCLQLVLKVSIQI